jgi:predicted nucleic acid-binding protein
MSDTLVDANVLIDVFAADPNWRDWSVRQLLAANRVGRLIINQIVFAEVAAIFPTQRRLDEAFVAVAGSSDRRSPISTLEPTPKFKATHSSRGTRRGIARLFRR